jgi:hypothetical protein
MMKNLFMKKKMHVSKIIKHLFIMKFLVLKWMFTIHVVLTVQRRRFVQASEVGTRAHMWRL